MLMQRCLGSWVGRSYKCARRCAEQRRIQVGQSTTTLAGVISASAVLSDQQGSYVFVVAKDNTSSRIGVPLPSTCWVGGFSISPRRVIVSVLVVTVLFAKFRCPVRP